MQRKLRRERVFRNRTYPQDFLTDTNVIERYRLPRKFCFRHINLVREGVEPDTHRSHALSDCTHRGINLPKTESNSNNVYLELSAVIYYILWTVYVNTKWKYLIAPKVNEAKYVCRRGYHAIHIQVVADASLRFVFEMNNLCLSKILAVSSVKSEKVYVCFV